MSASDKNIKLEIRFAGIGGQGLQAAAGILGKALIQEKNKFVCQSQNYGPESRGGLSYADLIISNQEIDFPKIKAPQVLVCMSNESFLKFKHEMFEGILTHMVIDPTMVTVEKSDLKDSPVSFHQILATLASEKITGNRQAANVVLVGAVHEILKIGNKKTIEKILAEEWPQLAEKNIIAFQKGIELAIENGKS